MRLEIVGLVIRFITWSHFNCRYALSDVAENLGDVLCMTTDIQDGFKFEMLDHFQQCQVGVKHVDYKYLGAVVNGECCGVRSIGSWRCRCQSEIWNNVRGIPIFPADIAVLV